jgi:hypothetical protein
VKCGAAECDAGGGIGAANSYCCERPDGSATCETQGNQCNGGVRLECDERLDCGDGGANRHCCLDFGGIGGGGATATCQFGGGGCLGGGLELCKTNAECPDGGACKTVSCGDGGGSYLACNTTNRCK